MSSPRPCRKRETTPSFRALSPGWGCPSLTAPTPVVLDLWRDELATCPTERKVDAALDLEREVRAGDPRIRQVETVNWGDSSSEMALASSLGISAADRSTACYLSAVAVAGEGVDSQVAYGYTVGRSPSDLVPSKAADDAVSRAVRMLGATKPRSARLPVVFEPRVSAQLLGLLGSVLSRGDGAEGRSRFSPNGWASRWPRRASRSLTTRPSRRPGGPLLSTTRASRAGATP